MLASFVVLRAGWNCVIMVPGTQMRRYSLWCTLYDCFDLKYCLNVFWYVMSI